MGIVFRQSVKSAIVTFSGAALGALIALINPALMEKEELGLITNITYLATMVQVLATMGTNVLVGVRTQRYDADDRRRKVLFTAGTLVTIGGSLLFAIAFMAVKPAILNIYTPEDQVLISKYYHYIPVVVLLMAVFAVVEYYLIANVKVAQASFSREIAPRVANLALLGFLFAGAIGFPEYVTGNALLFGMGLLLAFFFASRTQGFGFSFDFKLFSRAEYKDMARFSWYNLLVWVSSYVLGYMDTLMLAPLAEDGLKASAVYGIAVFIASVIFMPYKAMSTASLPILNEAYINNDMVKIKDLFSRSAVNITIACAGVFVLLAVNLDNAVAILPAGYEEVKGVAMILLLGKLVGMSLGLNNELISISKYYKFNFRITALLVVAVVVLNRIFIPQYGIYGAAWVVTGTTIIYNGIKMIFVHYKMDLNPFTSKTWRIFVAGAIAALAGYVWPYLLNPYIDAVARSLIVGIVYVVALIYLRPSDDLAQYIAGIRKNKRLF